MLSQKILIMASQYIDQVSILSFNVGAFFHLCEYSLKFRVQNKKA